MTDAPAAAERPAPAEPRSASESLRRRLRLAWCRHDGLRGYALISPALLAMILLLGAPLVSLIVLSFWTQSLFEFDTTPTLRNYVKLLDWQEFYRLSAHALALAADGRRCHHRCGAARLSDGLFPRLPGQAAQDDLAGADHGAVLDQLPAARSSPGR